MSALSNFIKFAAPYVASYSPEPISKAVATGVTIGQQQQEAKYQKKLAQQRQDNFLNEMESKNMFVPSDISQGSTTARNPIAT